jgi:hypothetical protein
MKKSLISIPIIILFIVCCEQPSTLYTFKIKNNTQSILIFESIAKDCWDSTYDTIKTSHEFIKRYPNHCYINYKDSLISRFFLILKVKPPNGFVNIDVFKRSNWIENKNLVGLFPCKGGDVSYALIINESDLK